jgi:hypothetical protein
VDDAQAILKLIEEVDPADTAKLDEIDARVEGFIRYLPAVRTTHPKEPPWLIEGHSVRYSPKPYTRSRDALKSIRPVGYWSVAEPFSDYGGVAVGESFEGKCESNGMLFDTTDIDPLPTEELAELHAIIQAIGHERALA